MVFEPAEGPASELIQRAWELSELADYRAAVETSTAAIELDPNSSFAYTIQGWALEGLGDARLGDARRAYERAVELDASARWPRTAIADLLRRSGHQDEAERLYRSVADDLGDPAPDRPRSLEFRGWSLYRLGRLDEAIEAFHASLQRAPGRLSVLFDLALSLLANGRTGEATDAYDIAIQAVRAADVRRRLAPLSVAMEDLDDALSSVPASLDLAAATVIRQRLHRELDGLEGSEPPRAGPPVPAF